MLFCFKGSGDHRDLHVLTHSFPTRRSSDLLREFLDPDRSPPTSAFPVVTAQQAGEPLVVRIDRWGYTPWIPEPLTAQSLRSEEHTSELQSLMRISYAVFC